MITPSSIASSLNLLKVCPPSVPGLRTTPNEFFILLKLETFWVPRLFKFIPTTSFENTVTLVADVFIGLFAAGTDQSIFINVAFPLNSISALFKMIWPFPSEYAA